MLQSMCGRIVNICLPVLSPRGERHSVCRKCKVDPTVNTTYWSNLSSKHNNTRSPTWQL